MGHRDEEHWYTAFWDPDLLLPSVTTILGYTWSKGALHGWNAGQAARYAVEHHDEMSDLIYDGRAEEAIDLAAGAPGRIKTAAGDLGKLVHRVADARIRGQILPLTEEERSAVAPFTATLDRFIAEMRPEYRWTEATMYHRDLLYAGTGDAGIAFGVPLPVVVRRTLVHTFQPGALLIGDYKTGNEIWPDTAQQVVGYGSCTHMNIRDQLDTIVGMPPVEGGAIIHLRPDGYRVHGVLFTPEMRAGWIHARRWFDVVHRQAKDSMGLGIRAGGFRIEDLPGIDVRVRNWLLLRGITTLADLEALGEDAFLGIKHAGPAGAQKARELLALEGRSWPEKTEELKGAA